MEEQRELRVAYKNGTYKAYSFKEFSELKDRADLNLTGVSMADIIARWPLDSVIPNHADYYVEVKDAVRFLKKRGFKFEAAKPLLREEKKEPEKTGEQKPAETPAPAMPEPKKNDGIYIVQGSEALVAHNGIEFVMPILRHGILSTSGLSYDLNERHNSEFGLAVKASSHRFGKRGTLVMTGLATLLETAESTQADLIAFTPSPRGAILSATGAYNFFKYLKDNPQPTFAGYDVAALREKLKSAKGQASQ